MTDRSAILARLVELAASNAGRDNLALRLGTACQTILGAVTPGRDDSVDSDSSVRSRAALGTEPTT